MKKIILKLNKREIQIILDGLRCLRNNRIYLENAEIDEVIENVYKDLKTKL